MGIKIFIDEGHNFSGADTGAIGYGLREQDITYIVGSKLGKLLENNGIEVKHSRTALSANVGDGTLSSSISKRYKMANDWKADYFISLHCDATPSSKARGSHICVYSLKGNAQKMAQAINPHLLGIGLEGRSVLISERNDLGVLKNTNMPAILIEMGFITNEHNSNLMKNHPDKLAEAICSGICEFLKIKRNKPEKEYVSTTDAIDILVKKGIITEPDKWYNGTWNDTDFKWLLRKVGTYLSEH